jgi:hypothetical protein
MPEPTRSARSPLRALLLASILCAAPACKGVIGGGEAAGDDGGDDAPGRVDAAPRPVDARRADASDPGDDDPGDDDPVTPDARTADARPQGRPDASVPDDDLEFRSANLTNFESYPEPGSEECNDFSGCQWAGRFAFVDGQQSEDWVRSHNIVAVHSDDADAYALKTLRLRADGNEIDVVVYDMCSDDDCEGCCTRNASRGGIGFLIDIEKYTMQRFGLGDGVVEWACLDCD